MHPVSRSNMKQKLNSFLRAGELLPGVPNSRAGIKNPSIRLAVKREFPGTEGMAALAATVAMVSDEVPTPLPTAMLPIRHEGPELIVGEIPQVSVTVEGSNPSMGVMVTLDVAEPPGDTEEGDSADAARLKSGMPTPRLVAGDVLLVKFASPA